MRRPVVFLLAFAVTVPLSAVPAGGNVPGVDATIIRDRWGVPHIYANDTRSLFYANGYAQAQDRLAQMDILRHVGKGELAKLTGPSGLELDLVTRRELYTHEERVAALAALPTEWQAIFQAFTDGVNQWIQEVTTDQSKMPVEYPALAEVPAPWAATDTVAIAQYLLDVFGRGGGGQEADNAKILDALRSKLGATAGERAFTDLVWARRADTYTTIKPSDGAPYTPLEAESARDLATIPAAQKEAASAAVTAELVDDSHATIGQAAAAAGFPFMFGSNAQLIDERFSANGKPLLFGGPQMGYFTPMIPYEVGLHGAGYDATGMGVAGAPGVIIGRTATQSWTVTSGSSDQVDLVAEKLVDDDRHYLVDGQKRAMDCRTETHLVRPGPADFAPDPDPNWRPPTFDVVTQEVCRTIHGPVLARTPDGRYAFASQRSYRGDEVRSGTLWLGVGKTTNRHEFQDLFDTFAFTFNFNYVNDGGDLMYMHVGRQPRRHSSLDPRLPRPGWTTTYDWNGFVSGKQLPHVVNPPSGYTVNWNNNPAVGWASGDQRELWGSIHRAELMDEALVPLLQAGNVTLDDLRRVNEFASTHEPYADDLFPLYRDAAVALGNPAALAAFDAWAAAKFDYADRNDDGFHDFAGFRLYELWRERMQSLVFDDELGTMTRRINFDPPSSEDPHAADHGQHNNKDGILVDIAQGVTDRPWCDDVRTAVAAESCGTQARAALAAAIAEVPDWAAPFPMRQSRFVALGAGPAYEIPMTNRPSFQHFYDWGVGEGALRSRNVLPPGASGHMNTADFFELQAYRNGFPGAQPPPHLEDQLRLYVDFGDKPLLFSRAAVEQHKEDRRGL